tara:strand:- start:248 stop:505 length:258 start_codon:yes stop_codon:yes gene_type:complete
MELNYTNIIIGFWIATVIMAVWRLWWPAISVLKQVKPDSITVKWWFLSGIIFSIMSCFIAPLLLPAVLHEKYRFRFVASYIEAVK